MAAGLSKLCLSRTLLPFWISDIESASHMKVSRSYIPLLVSLVATPPLLLVAIDSAGAGQRLGWAGTTAQKHACAIFFSPLYVPA
jgi:hypothetical protein